MFFQILVAKFKAMSSNRIVYLVVVILIFMQFFGIERHNPPIDSKIEFFSQVKADESIKSLVITACYDCHSNETNYPTYSYLQPAGWFIADHIEEGREHLNFSIWGQYSKDKRHHKVEECVEMIEEGEMPLKSYTILHPSANLNEEDKAKLISLFKKLM